ncbi:MAG: hypothetical protein ACOX2R_00290 [Anaerolineae bacterium]|jgi:hypothetical protein
MNERQRATVDLQRVIEAYRQRHQRGAFPALPSQHPFTQLMEALSKRHRKEAQDG